MSSSTANSVPNPQQLGQAGGALQGHNGKGPAPPDLNLKVEYDYWDPTPYSHIPMISQPLEPLALPETRIPSPLSRNLHPSAVAELYLFLCGPRPRQVGPRDALGYQSRHGGSGNAQISTEYRLRNGRADITGWTATGGFALGNGEIIWKAWKRAFDIWNNYYIEGRHDEEWVGKRLLEAEDEEVLTRYLKLNQPLTVGGRDNPIFPGPRSFLSQNEAARQDAESNTPLFMTKAEREKPLISPNEMDFELTDSSKIVEMPWVSSILQGIARRHVEAQAEVGIKVLIKHNRHVFVSDSDVGVANIILINPTATMQDSDDSLYQIDAQGTITIERTQKVDPFSDCKSTMVVVENKPALMRDFHNVIERIHVAGGSKSALRVIIRPYRDERTAILPQGISWSAFILNPTPNDRMITDECYLINSEGKSTDIKDVHQNGINLWTGHFVESTDVRKTIRKIASEHKAKKTAEDLTLALRRIDSSSWLLLLDWSYIRETDLVRIIDGKGGITDSEQHDTATIPSVWENCDLFDVNSPPESRALLSEKQREQDDRALGDGGGFYAMKNLPEYVEPDFDLPADVSWVDGLENTVWMPYRSGEKVTNIKIDQDVSKVGKEFEYDGGRDCSRSPHKLLEHVLKFGTKDDVNMTDLGDLDVELVKIWSGINGKVFNIPLYLDEPVQDPMQIDDEHAMLVREKYRKKLGLTTLSDAQNTYFPLDIRRLEKVPKDGTGSSSNPPPESAYALEGQDFNFPGSRPIALDMRDIDDPDDPWYITPEQKSLRAQINRGDPRWMDHEKLQPHQPIAENLLWKHELQKDDERETQYFVANLDGRTLIANGLEIKKGHVAGPLPPFVVFECPGGSIVFWWGTNHREHSGNLVGDERWEAAWAVTRRRFGWKYMAMNTGEAWDVKIKEMQAKVANAEEVWPEEWDAWRENARAARDEKETKKKAEEAAKPRKDSDTPGKGHGRPPGGPGDGGPGDGGPGDGGHGDGGAGGSGAGGHSAGGVFGAAFGGFGAGNSSNSAGGASSSGGQRDKGKGKAIAAFNYRRKSSHKRSPEAEPTETCHDSKHFIDPKSHAEASSTHPLSTPSPLPSILKRPPEGRLFAPHTTGPSKRVTFPDTIEQPLAARPPIKNPRQPSNKAKGKGKAAISPTGIIKFELTTSTTSPQRSPRYTRKEKARGDGLGGGTALLPNLRGNPPPLGDYWQPPMMGSVAVGWGVNTTTGVGVSSA
ncbi:hypothetical protein BP6252_08374 [Coleophoma cylindrospora]|uniref:Uncharacterized protein n=1 Tax=Coleophoma cylindrospora TaxID=1849047 RepID=A0A3D8R6B8_9HELO|nr:hypothetical protein BP6252_08374 [Coleophoma cylindrospora]